MKHAIEVGWRWDALILFDPPDVPPPSHRNYAAMEVFEDKLTEFARKRRRAFASIDELTEEYKASRATRHWVQGEHDLMARSVCARIRAATASSCVCVQRTRPASSAAR